MGSGVKSMIQHSALSRWKETLVSIYILLLGKLSATLGYTRLSLRGFVQGKLNPVNKFNYIN